MKKMYTDPDFEIVNIRLVTDILATSEEDETQVPTYDGGDMGWENGDF